MTIRAFAVLEEKSPIVDFEYQPIELGENEVEISIECCGVCHSDLHQANNDWGGANYPLVPGHEIVGKVVAKGAKVSGLEVGARVGVGPQTGSCEACESCHTGQEQNCAGKIKSYNSPTGDAVQPFTYGGFSESIRVNAAWAFEIPAAMNSVSCAPLLCAGITTWTPFARNPMPKGAKVGILGIGGLGHVAVQLSHHLGYKTVAISSSLSKRKEVSDLGADEFLNSGDEDALKAAKQTFDFILCTVSACIDWEKFMGLLKPMGTFCLVGLPSVIQFKPNFLVVNSIRFCGSYLACPSDIKEMIEFCAKHGVTAMTEELEMSADNANLALKKLEDNTPRYRIVLTNPNYSA